MKKYTLFLSALFLVISLAGCNSNNMGSSSNSGTPNPDSTSNSNSNIDTDMDGKNLSLKDFQGKPTVIFFGGTYCPHCQSEVPVLKAKVYDKYKDKINVWVNVIDGQTGKRFEVAGIPQGNSSNLNYNQIANENCQYVPSWVLLDANGKLIMASCGNSKSIEDLTAQLEEILNQ